MKEYKIERWDAIIPKGNTFPYPVVYFKPEENFENYIVENNIVLVKISNTNSTYDEKSVLGMVYNSGYFPSFRPNFFNNTGYYLIVIFTNWIGYPDNNGNLTINFSSENKQIERFDNTDPPKIDNSCFLKLPNDKKNLEIVQIYYILLIILLIFSGLLIGSFYKKR